MRERKTLSSSLPMESWVGPGNESNHEVFLAKQNGIVMAERVCLVHQEAFL